MTMPVTGVLILIFLVVHLLDFRLAERDPDGLAAMVVARLQSQLAALVYVVGVLALGVHLWHAFQSAFQSLGLFHPRYRELIRNGGRAFAVLVAVGFAAFPAAILMAPSSLARGSEPGAEVQRSPQESLTAPATEAGAAQQQGDLR
jgi:succinate dehydrogenase/fumarate reductase cytochrome b subunit (b558 family)